MMQASSNVDVLSSAENVKVLNNILKTNVAACVSIGTFFVPQISRNFLDMLELYKAVSSIISTSVATDGKHLHPILKLILTRASSGLIATKTPKIRGLRTIKKEVLKLMETYIKKAEEVESVNASFIPQLLDAILGDYNRNDAQARDAEVLNVMATITLRMGVRSLFTATLLPLIDFYSLY
jgi:exportin-1